MRQHHHHQGVTGWVALVLGALLLSACEAGAAPDDDPGSSGAGSRAGVSGVSDATTVTLAFAGDVHFEGGLVDLPRQQRSTLGPMSQALREADVAMVNLESALTNRGTPAMKELEDPSSRYWFRSPPATLGVLDRSGVDVVSLANNHGADYGVAGIRDTVRIAADSPVSVVGVGLDDTQAFAPYEVNVRGTDVAVFAADASPLESVSAVWTATPGSGPGLASARGDAARLVAAVRESEADVVVVYLHWGEESNSCATPSQRTLAQALSRAGADVLVGTHAHLPVGAGLLDRTYVSYGLGNFLWYHGNQSDTGVLRLAVTGAGIVDDEWLPARIRPEGGNPQPLTGRLSNEAVASWRALRGCTDLAPGPGAGARADPVDALAEFTSAVRTIGPTLREQIRVPTQAACPVPLADLRHLSLSYVGFDGRAHRGVMIVNADVAADVVGVFADLYDARFPIQRMRLVDAYGGDDNRSMAANNTSAYNCRLVAGSGSFSEHAYGRAIDINPVQNPYVVGTDVRPRAARPFVSVDRSAGGRGTAVGRGAQAGVIREGDVVSRAFARLGWTWGGDYSDPDFQHFSAP